MKLNNIQYQVRVGKPDGVSVGTYDRREFALASARRIHNINREPLYLATLLFYEGENPELIEFNKETT